MSKLDFSEMFQMKPLWNITNETFMRYLVQIELFVIIFIMKLISHKCFKLDISQMFQLRYLINFTWDFSETFMRYPKGFDFYLGYLLSRSWTSRNRSRNTSRNTLIYWSRNTFYEIIIHLATSKNELG